MTILINLYTYRIQSMLFILYYIRHYFKAKGLPEIMLSQIVKFLKKTIHPNIKIQVQITVESR